MTTILDMKYNISSLVPQPFQFEKMVDAQNRIKWIETYWHYSIYWTLLYLITIFSTKHYMRNHPAFQLRIPLTVWNLGLATFSIFGTIRMVPGLYHIVSEFGFTFSVCNIKYILSIQPTVFWGWLFLCSKVVEFGDTMFIVLRKKKLVFLHYYHHIMTLLIGWYSASHLMAALYWLSTMNYFVHSLMYLYFMLSSMGMKLTRAFAMAVTTVQLLQMFCGTFICFWGVLVKYQGVTCEYNYRAIIVTSLLGLTYIFLFGRLFYVSYIHKKMPNSSTLKKD